MNFSDQSRFNVLFQQVAHKGGKSAINYIKRFQNDKGLAISVGISYTEDHLTQNFSDNFTQGGKYSDKI